MPATTKQSLFPDYPRENPILDTNGRFMPLWELGLSSLFQALQENFKNEGIIFPSLTADQMKSIQNLYLSYIGGTYEALTLKLPDISGQTIFDDDTVTSNQFIIASDAAMPPKVVLAEWVPFAYMKTYAGNPNGHVSGVLNWLCYDSSGKVLYICTGTGSTTTATWQNI